MSIPEAALVPLRKFRLSAVRYSLLVVLAVAAILYGFHPVAAHGFALGGVAGVLGFWIIAKRLEKLATLDPQKVKFAALTWTFFRFLLYGAALYRAYSLDTESAHGLVGAAAGILVIRFVTVFMGVTGIDMPKLPASEAELGNSQVSTEAADSSD